LQLYLLPWSHNDLSLGSLEDSLQLRLLVVHGRQIFKVLTLLLAHLHVDGVELLLESGHSPIQIGVHVFLSNHNTLIALSGSAPLCAAAWTDRHDLILWEIGHHLSLLLCISVLLVTG
jgi:hypothetical protein